MPPKKRAAAAAQTAPDPAQSRARSTRDAKTEEPASATTTTRSKRGATQKTAAEEPAKKKTKTTTVAEVQEEILAQVQAAPKRRGRPAKSNGPSTAVTTSVPEIKTVTTPKRGRSSVTHGGEVAEDVATDPIATAPKRRGRPAKAVAEAKVDPVPEVSATDITTPKRRGRPSKADARTKGDRVHEEVAEDAAPAKRRGHPAKVNGTAKVNAKEPPFEAAAASKRRGRPAKAATTSTSEAQENGEEISSTAEPAKRRGRPAKPSKEEDTKKATSGPTTTRRPKRGGKAASKAAEEPSTEAATAAATAPKRRGRPPKATTAVSGNVVAGRKRDRSASSQLKDELKDTVDESNAAGKGRGRKKPTATETTVTGPSDEPPPKKVRTTTKATKAQPTATEAPAGKRGRKPASASKNTASQSSAVEDTTSHNDVERETEGPSYWLMKAEPDTRLENGVDVRFSIDDLKAKGRPEPWDGVRNVVAMSNMKNMRKGDLAFFYHSNTKVPGIAGIMEIVEESSPDESAFDPNHYRYDPKSSRDSPKWHCVHVSYRHKFTKLVPLKDLQANAKDDGPLSSMQLFKQSRLSVSKVSKNEWDFIMSMTPGFESEEAEQPKETDDATTSVVAAGTDLVPTVEAALLGTDEVVLPVDQQPLATSNGYDEAITEGLVQTHSPKSTSKPTSRVPSATPAARKPSSRASSRAASLAPNGRAPSAPQSVRSTSRGPSVPRSTRGASRPLSADASSAKVTTSRGPSAPPADASGNVAVKEMYGLGGEGGGEGPAGPDPSAELGPAGAWVSPVEMALKGVAQEEGF